MFHSDDPPRPCRPKIGQGLVLNDDDDGDDVDDDDGVRLAPVVEQRQRSKYTD